MSLPVRDLGIIRDLAKKESWRVEVIVVNDGSKDDPREGRADHFAVEFLIPSSYDSVIRRFNSKNEAVSLAKELGISPAIVAGRYQHLTQKWHFFKELIMPLKWKE